MSIQLAVQVYNEEDVQIRYEEHDTHFVGFIE